MNRHSETGAVAETAACFADGVNRKRSDFCAPMPRKLLLELSNYCNLRCPKCPTGQKMDLGERGFLSFENLKRLLDSLPDFKGTIVLASMGEAFMNPQWYDLIKLATSQGIRTTVSSNLSHNIPNFPAKIIESGLSKMTVAIDGATAETYSIFRKRGDFSQVLNNLDKIIEKKKRQSVNHPQLVWQMVLTRHNQNEVEAAREMARTRGMDFKLKPLRQENIPENVSGGDWQPTAEIWDKFMPMFEVQHQRARGINRCADLWQRPNINWDGELFPCCIVYEKAFSLGNVFEQGFGNVWNGDKARAARRLVMEDDYSADFDTACEKCRYRHDGSIPDAG